MYQIEMTSQAHKELKKIDHASRVRIAKAIDRLANWPSLSNVRKLTGRTDYRLRVGSYRVIFRVAQTVQIITVTNVRKRDERTY